MITADAVSNIDNFPDIHPYAADVGSIGASIIDHLLP